MKNKPCPFCGTFAPELLDAAQDDMFYFKCLGCGIETEVYIDFDDLVKFWNTRHKEVTT